MITRNSFLIYMKKLGLEKGKADIPENENSWVDYYYDNEILFAISHDTPDRLFESMTLQVETQIQMNDGYVLDYSTISVSNEDLRLAIIPFNGTAVSMFAEDGNVLLVGMATKSKRLNDLFRVFMDIGMIPEGVKTL